MQNNNSGVRKTKSKTLLNKFMAKFGKNKNKPAQEPTTKGPPSTASRERSSDNSKGKRQSRSPSKGKVAPQQITPTIVTKHEPSAPKTDIMEVTAKAFRDEEKKKTKESKTTKETKEPAKEEKKEKKSHASRKREKEKEEKSEQITALQKSPSLSNLKTAESTMEMGNQKVEKAVKAWIEILEKNNFVVTVKSEFEVIYHIQPDLEKCAAYKKNMSLCQSTDTAFFDSNRVTVGDGDLFYHGSVITIPNIVPKVIIAQLPLINNPQSLEAYWLMVAANKMQRVFVLCGPNEIDKKKMGEYFPEDFVEYKTIRVNNRKTVLKDVDHTNDMLYYEVVPKDCAEAPFAMMEICDFWPDGKIPSIMMRPSITAGCVFESDIDPDATIGIVSRYGAGRSGSLLVAAIAIERLRAGETPAMKDLASNIRLQRPGAIETAAQYAYCHIMALNYGLKHVTNASLKTKIEKVIAQLEQFASSSAADEGDENDVNDDDDDEDSSADS